MVLFLEKQKKRPQLFSRFFLLISSEKRRNDLNGDDNLHLFDFFIKAAPELIKLDLDRCSADAISPSEEMKALGLCQFYGVSWRDILNEDDLKRSYKALSGTRGYATARVQMHAYVPTDREQRLAEASARDMRRDKTNDHTWKDTVQKMMAIKEFRMQEPVMVVSPSDFERLNKTDAFSSFPVGSKWFKLEGGAFEEIPSDPPLLLSEEWKACFLKTVKHYDIPEAMAAGPLFICILADVVPFVADPLCPVPALNGMERPRP